MRSKLFLFLIVFLLLSSPSYATIALLDSPVTFDNGELGTTTATRGSTTTSSGTLTMGIVTVHTYDNAACVVSSVTKGADNYILGVKIGRQGGSYNEDEIWYKLNPTAASSTVTVTMNNTVTGIYATYSTWQGVKQDSQPDATATNSGASDTSPQTDTITVVHDNSLIIDSFNSDAGAGTPSQTAMGNGASYKIAGSGSQGMTWTSGVGDSFIHAIISFQPDLSGGGSRRAMVVS